MNRDEVDLETGVRTIADAKYGKSDRSSCTPLHERGVPTTAGLRNPTPAHTGGRHS